MQMMTNDTTALMTAWRQSGGAPVAAVTFSALMCAYDDEMLSASAISTNNSFSCLNGADEAVAAAAITFRIPTCI